jgi:hypothetical protein
VRSLSGATPIHGRLPTRDSIRLLYVERRSRELVRNGKKERLLDCRLSTRRLPGPGNFYKYNALSYHWGNLDDPHYIVCNGQFVSVSAALHEALSQYRKSGQEKPLWVDALCINQKNTDERSRQVHLMTDIYELADMVIVWLGSCTRRMEQAFERLACGRILWEKTGIVCETTIVDGEEIVIPGRGQECAARVVQSRVEQGLIQLFSVPWFERCWVFQEILLAERAVLWCGSLEMKWPSFVRHCEELEDGSESMNSIIHKLSNDVVLNVEELRQRFRSASRQDRPPLSRILIDTWQRKATDERDKIFSVLGLLEDTVLRADYSLTIRETYMAAARSCILQDQHLGLLCLTELSQTASERAIDQARVELPSWVPRWGSPGKHTRLQGNSSLPDFGHLSVKPTAVQRLLRNADELALQGVAIGYLATPERRLVSLELRPFVRCARNRTDQSLPLDRMLAIERPEDRDTVADLYASMSYYYGTEACHCMEKPTPCIARTGLPCQLSSTGSSDLPALSASRDWVCAVQGGTGFLVLRPRLDKSGTRDVFTLIGVTSYTLTSSILLSMRSEQQARARSESSWSTALSFDWSPRALEIILV